MEWIPELLGISSFEIDAVLLVENIRGPTVSVSLQGEEPVGLEYLAEDAPHLFFIIDNQDFPGAHGISLNGDGMKVITKMTKEMNPINLLFGSRGTSQ